MAKKQPGRPKSPTGEGVAIRVDSDVASMAKYIAAAEGVAISKLVSDILRPTIERKFAKLGQKLNKPEAPPER